MKILAVTAALAASAFALPAAAQTWWNPTTYFTGDAIHNAYVEIDGGATFQGHSSIDIAATGLGASSNSAPTRHGLIGGALLGYNLAPGLSFEAEGVYTRNHYAFPNDPIFGQGGAVRTYGGLGNVKLSMPDGIIPRVMGVGFTPFVAGGIGYGEVRYQGHGDGFAYTDYQDGFMYQGKAGIEVKVGQHVGVSLAYRYLQAPDFTTPGSFHGADYSGFARSHVQGATLGLKYNF